ncbi:tyrosine-protein kinase domain-containing protein [Deinococcus radiophilus]|uniref:Chromosome partitioning protein n=1 Tax=Deinococcus radiophilus TaxID=32062 RepID=A0A431VYS6_9DEIO|nr:tyrosine-protein kinase domain-containing protein [Deinococcus radiophilus]RTR28039.1 chromosome partitioning protein [Deinococcus radiophilus]UFA51507.1 P-loop NTPase [Deinococcus radiophilus]
MTVSERPNNEFDLNQLLRVLRRTWPWVLAATLLVSGLVYAWSNAQPRQYEASGTVMATAGAGESNAAINSVVVSPPQLPQGAVAELLNSQTFLDRVMELVRDSGLPLEQKEAITSQLRDELASNSFASLGVRARVDAQQRGIYEVQAVTGDPEGSRVLADSAIKALLEWDTERVRGGISRARQTWERQITNLSSQIENAEPGSVDEEALVTARGEARLNLAQVEVLEESVTPSLSRLADANTSPSPITPRPLRNTVLAGLLTLLGAAALAVLLDLLRRRVRGTGDLISVGAPVIGELPRLRKAQRAAVVSEVQTGNLYEPASFIRINLERLAERRDGSPASFVITSARPGEGKSTVAASTAASFAATGQRVLLIDVDVHRPTQQEFWNLSGRPWVPLAGAEYGQPTTVLQAAAHPETASAADLGNGVFVLPAAQVSRREAGVIATRGFVDLLERWKEGFDVVIYDTAPALSVADAMVVGEVTDGLVLVVEAGGTSVQEVERVVQGLRSTRVHLLGVVLNKISAGSGYGYSYSYGRSYTRS